MNGLRKRELLQALVSELRTEYQDRGMKVPELHLPPETSLEDADTEDLWLEFRSLVNVREPWPASEEFLARQDELLSGLVAEAGVATPADVEWSPIDPRIGLWRGDITELAADAIVNAANSGMTGCWAPLHYCIDNAIHTYAGVQLRLECAGIMAEQGRPENTAEAKITPAYNLPSEWVIHTVGPIADGYADAEDCSLLAQSYTACLDAAAALSLQRRLGLDRGFHDDASFYVAFPCISTGVFGFPQEEAAEIAVRTVRDWLSEHPDSDIRVIFNVFDSENERLYRRLLHLQS